MRASKASDRPKLKLTGRDGNAFFMLGRAQETARKAGWPKSKVEEFMRDAKSGDYDDLLRTCMKWFDVS